MSLLNFLTTLGLARTFIGILAAHTVAVLPYVIRTVTASLVNTDPHIEEAAADFGATRLEVLALVVAPIVKGGLIAGTLFAFIMSWMNVEISIFLECHGWLHPARHTLQFHRVLDHHHRGGRGIYGDLCPCSSF